jgi:hypothetical protein
MLVVEDTTMSEPGFKILTGQNPNTLAEQVQSYLNDGWQLHGDMVVTRRFTGLADTIVYSQAMKKI